tara:strand:+ start:293 stop:475 length:183 start_codon:yes stop_codon:yes gene_type:complete
MATANQGQTELSAGGLQSLTQLKPQATVELDSVSSQPEVELVASIEDGKGRVLHAMTPGR